MCVSGVCSPSEYFVDNKSSPVPEEPPITALDTNNDGLIDKISIQTPTVGPIVVNFPPAEVTLRGGDNPLTGTQLVIQGKTWTLENNGVKDPAGHLGGATKIDKAVDGQRVPEPYILFNAQLDGKNTLTIKIDRGERSQCEPFIDISVHQSTSGGPDKTSAQLELSHLAKGSVAQRVVDVHLPKGPNAAHSVVARFDDHTARMPFPSGVRQGQICHLSR